MKTIKKNRRCTRFKDCNGQLIYEWDVLNVEEYQPTYRKIELILSDEQTTKMWFSKELIGFDECVKKYGEHQVLSVQNFDGTKTTSIIISRKPTANIS